MRTGGIVIALTWLLACGDADVEPTTGSTATTSTSAGGEGGAGAATTVGTGGEGGGSGGDGGATGGTGGAGGGTGGDGGVGGDEGGSGGMGGAPSCAPTVLPSGATVLASGQQRPTDTVVDATHVYWTDEAIQQGGTAYLKRAPIDGGCVEVLASSTLSARRPHLDGGYVYWGNDQQLLRTPIGGGVTTVLADNLATVVSLVTDSSHVYFTTFDGGQVVRLPKGGGAPEILASGQTQPIGLSTDGSFVYWANKGNNVAGQASIARVPIGGGPVTTLLAGISIAQHTHVANGLLYFLSSINGTMTIQRMPLTGGSPIAITNTTSAIWFESDATHIYFSECVAGNVRRVEIGGGSPELILGSQICPLRMTIDGPNVYWANRNSGVIMKMPKP